MPHSARSGFLGLRWVTAKLVVGVGLTAGLTAVAARFLDSSGIPWSWLAPVVVGLSLAILAQCLIHRPLVSLTAACHRIAGGDYDRPVRTGTRDEIGALAASLEQMRLAIKSKAERLDETAARFQTLFEQVPCYVTVQDADFRLVTFNKRFEADFGHHVGQHCYKVFKQRSSICPDCAVQKSFSDGRIHSAEETVISRDGSVIHFLNLAAPITDSQGNIQSVMEMATDITPIRRLEAELIESERKHRMFFNNDPNSILILDRENLAILDHNDRAALMYGREDLTSASFYDLIRTGEKDRLREFISAGAYLLPRVGLKGPDGTEFIANLRASHWDYNGRPAVILSAVDITTWLETENQLIQAGKMATLGEMSAGVAHELNQPLTVIGSGSGFLRKQVRRNRELDPELVLEVAEEISGQVERATKIINHLREFGRKNEVDRVLVEISRPILGVFHLLGRQLEVHDIEIRLDMAAELPFIWAEPNRLEQVFINLIINARDAIESRLEDEPGGPPGLIEVAAYPDGESVVAEVRDNGTGVAVETLNRIFEPFFTTKQVGRGAGLGLSISYGIVRDYEGTIEVESNEDRGTTFRLTFPAAGEETDEPW